MAMSTGDKNGFTGINVTPLTDVMLVLLITFLLTASSFEEQEIDIPLPRVVEMSEVEKDTAYIVVEQSGTVRWPDTIASDLDPVSGFRAFKTFAASEVLSLAVHRDMSYKKLYPLLVAANEGGWTRVVLLTETSP